jgi:hypothetical protein
MMNEPEKSDPSTVAAKPANKTGRSDAESAEPREGAKGNTPESHTRRTQSRASVSPGLERVRERARQGKKERLTALLQHVTVDLLRTAYLKLKRDAAPGVDGTTWREYGHDLEPSLWICMDAFIAAPIGRCPRGVSSSRKRMGEKGRLGLLRWKMKSSSEPWWRCSMRFTSQTFSAFHTDFD